MYESFIKAVKWYVVMLFVIGGAAAFSYAGENETHRMTGPGVLSIGAAFIMVVIWKDLHPKIMFVSGAAVAAFVLFSPQLPVYIHDYTGRNIETYTGSVSVFTPYFLAAAIVALIGIPLMAMVFRRFG